LGGKSEAFTSYTLAAAAASFANSALAKSRFICPSSSTVAGLGDSQQLLSEKERTKATNTKVNNFVVVMVIND
jgi:hypothetical protein